MLAVDASLTAREREVIVLVGQGLTNDEVGRRLGIAVRTVHVYLASINAKLGTDNRTSAVLAAIHCGIISLEECV